MKSGNRHHGSLPSREQTVLSGLQKRRRLSRNGGTRGEEEIGMRLAISAAVSGKVCGIGRLSAVGRMRGPLQFRVDI